MKYLIYGIVALIAIFFFRMNTGSKQDSFLQKETIRSGKGIGPLIIGETDYSESKEKAGSPRLFTEVGRGGMLVEYASGIQVCFAHTHSLVARIGVGRVLNSKELQNRFNGQTAKGIKIGSPKSLVEEKYGKPEFLQSHDAFFYYRSGISFSFENDQVIAIEVHAPCDSKNCEDKLLSFCRDI